MTDSKSSRQFQIGINAVLILVTLMVVLPFLLVFVSSITDENVLIRNGYSFFPEKISFYAYQYIIRQGDKILRAYGVTILATFLGTILNVAMSALMAYPLSVRTLPYRRGITFFIFFTMLFNGGILPLYLQMRELRLTNTLWSVVLASGVNVFYSVLARNYFCSLPKALIESAQLDGAGEWRILFSIILPISKPILATITLFYMVDRWNEWYNALIFIRDNGIIPLQVALRSIVMESNISSSSSAQAAVRNFDMGIKMGAVMLTSLPIMCVFPFLQKHFAKGVMVGAIKA